jgi:hypothetical protein
MEQSEFDEMLRTLVRIAAYQETINTDQRAMNERLITAIERIDRTLAHVEITQARMETLLARLLRQEDNGRQA